MNDPNCATCHGTGIAGGHWLGDKWCDHVHTWWFCDCGDGLNGVTTDSIHPDEPVL